jgi:lipoyl(octanoyl) transferase
MKDDATEARSSLEVYDLGRAEYRGVWDLQKQLQGSLIQQKRNPNHTHYSEDDLADMLLFVEHPHVYTLGKSGNSEHLLRSTTELNDIQAEFVPVDRGGDITYHGPGQVVGYPILDLDRHFTDIHKYLRFLEEVLIRTLGKYNLQAGREEGQTGVWLNDRKIAAMGIRSSRWVTMHGFALNVTTDMDYFSHIVPCGIQDKQVTSLQREVGTEVSLDLVKKQIVQSFEEVFEVQAHWAGGGRELEDKISYFKNGT